MAKIVDPDNINFAVNATATTQEFELQTGAKSIKANISSTNLDDVAPGKTSGATGRALYSALKIEWLSNTTLRRYKFPIKMIFEGSFIVTNGWTFLDDQTRDVMRDAGFQDVAAATEWACMVSLGAMDDDQSDLAYFVQTTGFTAATTVYDKTGELNENIEITSNKTYQKSFLREQGKLFSEYALLFEQGLSTLNFQAYSFPLSNGTDLKVSASDITIGGANDPYQNMDIDYLNGNGFTTMAVATYSAEDVIQDSTGRWFFCTVGGLTTGTDVSTGSGAATFVAYLGEYKIGSSYYAFNRLVDCATGTHIEAYEYVQYELRQAGDINTAGTAGPQGGYGTVNGAVAELLGEFVGDNLKPKPGVLYFNFDINSTNNIQHSPIGVDGGGLDSNDVPVTYTEIPFPFVAAGNVNFSSNLDDELDAETVYDFYFEYITSTSGLLTYTSSSTNTTTLTYTGTLLDHLVTGDYINITGSTTTANDGEYLVGTVTAGTSVALTHQDTTVVIVDDAETTLQVYENPFGSLGATLVHGNTAASGDDIAFVNATSKITSSVTDLSIFIADNIIHVEGTSNNNGYLTVVSSTATEIVVSETLTDESSGTSFTISKTLTGEISSTSITWDFDYTNNVQEGRTADSDAAIHVIAMALDGSEWTDATHTISKSTGQSIAVNGNDERNYSNPA